MRTPRRLVAALAATALGWGTLTLVVAAPAEAGPAVQAGKHKRDAPHDPATYYAGTEGLSGTALATALNAIIDGNTFIPYTSSSTDVWDALKVLDRDPNNANRIIDAYSGDSLDAANQCGSSCALDGWNREHTWAQSRGSFNTDAGPGTDLFHMRPLRGNTNSSRGNKDFDNGGAATVPGCPICKADGDSFEPRDSFKGDLARGLFYMDVRFNGDADDQYGVDLRMWDQVGNSGSQIGKLSTLVAWSLADPPDAGELNRNNLIDGDYQHNRNPFIDHPEWVCSIWGSSNPTACSNTNQPPTITSPTTKSTLRDTPFLLALTATDPNGDPLTWSLVAPAASHGTASITGSAPNFSLSYTPAPGYDGPDSVGVQVSDGKGGLATATIQITVTATNHPPTVEDIGPVNAPKNNSKQITLLGNDVDAGDTLTFSVVSQPARGTVTILGNVATYSSTGYTGDDSFSYRATDTSMAQSAPATVSVTVGNSPGAPVTTPVSTTTNEDEAKTFTLTASDPDGDALTFAITSQPTKGSVSREGDEAIYTPDLNANGPDTFNWSVTDGTTTVNSTVSITVTPVNDPPVANAASATTAEDIAKAITLSGSDPDGQALTYTVANQPSHGSVTIIGATATYTPTANHHGPDSFTYTASDGTASSTPATVSITVTPVNDAPTATTASASTDEDTAKVINLAGNDAEGSALTFAKASDPAHGTVSITPAGAATYTPAANYNGEDSFTFSVNDGTLTSTPATVTITVTAVNDAPTATAAAPTTDEDTAKVINLAGNDAEGSALTFAKASDPAHGTVSITPAGAATYTPAANYHGPDSFTFTVNDGALTSTAATISVTVTAVNDAPTVEATTLTTTAGTPVTATLDVADPDGDPVTITSATTPTHGSVTFSGTDVTYTPTTTSGTDSFSVTVSDGQGGTDSAQVDVTITARTAVVTLSTPTATRGKPVTTTITATGPAGTKPSGLVTLKSGATTLGTALLRADGTAAVTWTPGRAGPLNLVATYAGDIRYDPATSAPASVTVAKSVATLTFRGKLKRGQAGKVKVAVTTVSGVAATGKITIKVGTKSFTKRLKNGVATFKIGKVPDKAKLKVKATYTGDAQYAAGVGRFKFTLT